MKVNLTYFTTRGKYYSEGEFETGKEHMFEIYEEVRDLVEAHKCPGLVEGHSDFIVLVSVPDHPTEVPALIYNLEPVRDEIDETILYRKVRKIVDDEIFNARLGKR